MMEFASSERTLSPVFNKNDKSFVSSINNFIENELDLLNSVDGSYSVALKEKYLIYKQAFSKIISYVQVYKSLLSNIKREYEFCINELENNQLNHTQTQEEIIRLEGSTATLNNLKLRLNELELKLNDYKIENTRLTSNLNKLLTDNTKYRPNEADNMLNSKYAMTKEQFAYFKEKSQLADEGPPKGPIKGLNLERSTDLKYLTDLLHELETKIVNITATQAKKYATKQQKQELERNLFEKMSERDKMQEDQVSIKNNMLLYKYAIQLAKEYYQGDTKYTSIQDALSRGLIESFLTRRKSRSDEDDDYDTLDDPNQENESEFILEYLENFNDLFDSEKYIQAAYYAAASPKNILRNIETLYKFKKLTNNNEYTEETDPLLVYCMSVIDSINDDASKPNVEMSMECIKVILKYHNLDFLTRLIAQRRIRFSYQAAKLIEEYAFFKPKNSKSLFELALFIYKDINASFEAAVCIAKLDRFSAMMDFIKAKSDLAAQIPDIYFKILEECPSIELACEIMGNSTIKNLKIPIDKIVAILLDSDHPENGLKFLKIQIQKNSKAQGNNENLKKLKASYETLVKFSFLTAEEEEFTKSLARESRDQMSDMLINHMNQKSKVKTVDVNNEKSQQKLVQRRNSLKKSDHHGSIAEDDEENGEEGTNDSVMVKGDMAYDRRSSVTSTLRSNVNVGVPLLEEEDETD